MKRQWKKVMSGVLVAGFVTAGLLNGAAVHAANLDAAVTETTVSDASIKEMLAFAIADEYVAQAEYQAYLKAFDVQRPFSNLERTEATHIELLKPLLEEYNVTIPTENWSSKVVVPSSLEAAYAAGVETEKKSIEVYEGYLDQTLPEDVRLVFERLVLASERHMNALQRQLDGVACTTGREIRNGSCSQSGNQNGRGNRGLGQRFCMQ